MRYILVFALLVLSCSAKTYYAKVEPNKKISINSYISGVVTDVKSCELEYCSGVVVEIDSTLAKENLELLQENLMVLDKKIASLLKIVEIQETNFKKINALQSKPQIQKDTQELALLNSKISLQQAKEQKNSIEMAILKEKDFIKKSKIEANNLYISKIYPNKGEYLQAGQKVYDAYDLKSAKLEIFISASEAQNLKSVRVGDMVVSDIKLSKVSDELHISSYRVEIYLEAPEIFSNLVEVELLESK